MTGEENLGRAVLALGTDDTGMDQGLDAAEGKSQSWVTRVGGVLGKGLAVGAGVAIGAGVALTAVLADSVAGAMEAEKGQAALEAVLRSTGGASGMTAEAVNDLASSLSEVTTFEDDAIVAGDNMLLTFTNIGKDVFPAATEAMLDMSTATGQDMQSSAVQLGKALNDPIAGVSALSRVGVTFTEQQKEQIKAMQDAGDTAGAQKVILAELSKEFGGAAEAAGSTFAGKMEILNNQIGNVKDEIGAALIPVLADLATEYGPALIQFAKDAGAWIQSDLIPAIQDIVAWLKVNLPPAIKFATDAWNNVLYPAIKAIYEFIKDPLIPIISEIINWLSVNIPPAIAIAVQAFETIRTALDNVRDFIDRVITKYREIRDALTNLRIPNPFADLLSKVSELWDTIRSFLGFLDNIKVPNPFGGLKLPSIPGFDSAAGGALAGNSLLINQALVPALATPGGAGSVYNIDARGSSLSEAQIQARFEAALRVAGQTTDDRRRTA
jgi:hypothetical protein